MVMQFGADCIKNKIRRNCLDRPWLANLIAGHCNRFDFWIVNQREGLRKEANGRSPTGRRDVEQAGIIADIKKGAFEQGNGLIKGAGAMMTRLASDSCAITASISGNSAFAPMRPK